MTDFLLILILAALLGGGAAVQQVILSMIIGAVAWIAFVWWRCNRGPSKPAAPRQPIRPARRELDLSTVKGVSWKAGVDSYEEEPW